MIIIYFCEMQKSKRFKSLFFGSLFSLLVPLGCYLFLKFSGHEGRMPLPNFYGIEKIDTITVDGKSKIDTTYRTLNDIKLITQLGDSISLNENFKGKILVVNFFKTTCTSGCITNINSMKLLNKAFIKNDTSIRFVSISLDVEKDSVIALRKFADEKNANHDKWLFCTGNKNDIENYYNAELETNNENQFVLIDKYRNIRGYYDGLDSNKVRKCAEDIAYLMVEKNLYHEKNRRR